MIYHNNLILKHILYPFFLSCTVASLPNYRPLKFPSPSLSHVTSCGQWDTSNHDISRDLKLLVFLLSFYDCQEKHSVYDSLLVPKIIWKTCAQSHPKLNLTQLCQPSWCPNLWWKDRLKHRKTQKRIALYKIVHKLTWCIYNQNTRSHIHYKSYFDFLFFILFVSIHFVFVF